MSASSLMSLLTSRACSISSVSDVEHVEQITGNTDEVVAWGLFDQPTKPVNAEVEVGGQKKLHGFWKSLFIVVEMSSIAAGRRKQRRHFYALFSTHCYEQALP